jgi:hypothetical protein
LTPFGDKSFPNPGVYREMGDRLFLSKKLHNRRATASGQHQGRVLGWRCALAALLMGADA